MHDEALADFVRERAHQRCEYCQTPQAFSPDRLQIDHIIAEQHDHTPKNSVFMVRTRN
jgi:hypothetical protein